MFDLAGRISAFEVLGRFIGQYQKKDDDDPSLQKLNRHFWEEFQMVIDQAGQFNNWFTRDNVDFALQQWSDALKAENLHEWTNKYSADHFENDGKSIVAIIMAGNLPLVGLHDMLSVLISGHRVLIKPSSDDSRLLPFICQILVAIDSRFADRIRFAENKLTDFEAVIATGSNNSARYFDYYFGKYPHIIRKNRTSVAVLNGDESDEDLKLLGEDIFRYFGLGCRSVSKLYLPNGFKLDRLFEAFYGYRQVIDNNKYGNNYDYNRAIYLMERIPFLENGFLIMRENQQLHTPAAVLHYEYYDDAEKLREELESVTDQLQCVVSRKGICQVEVDFGQSQKPRLWDYADKVDTIKFLRTV